MPLTLDLNADLGEGAGSDEALLDLVTSANIACGGHAGDAASMRAAVSAALERGVAIGAHPAYPDREGFGRRPLTLSAAELTAALTQQLRALVAVCDDAGATVRYVKPHGALYHAVVADAEQADAVLAAVAGVLPATTVLGLPGSELVRRASGWGLAGVGEAFAERGYRPDGTLVPRGQPGALLHDPGEAAARIVRLAREGRLTAVDGGEVTVDAASVCVHGDGAEAVAFARAIRQGLVAAGVDLRPFAP